MQPLFTRWAKAYPFRAVVLCLLVGLLNGSSEARTIAQFPSNFKWCVATAAHQIEGNNVDSDWWEFENQPPLCTNGTCKCNVTNCEKSGAATDHWNRVDEDIAAMKKIAINQYRFSVEWAKIEPQQGHYNLEAIAHYKAEVEKLQAAGIEPMITLQHFTFPRWLRALGGWNWEGTPDAFARFTDVVIRQIAPKTRDWVTVNEPLVHLGTGYVVGNTPPGNPVGHTFASENSSFTVLADLFSFENPTFGGAAPPTPESLRSMIPPLVGLLKAHARAYQTLHKAAQDLHTNVRVGMAHHLRIFDPKNSWSPADNYATSIVDNFWNWAIPDALETGRLRASIPTVFSIDETIPGLAHTQDYMGVNYYSRDIVSMGIGNGFQINLDLMPGASTNDMGWEIYPQGLTRILQVTFQRYRNLKILITENGTADAQDAFRINFLKEHLLALQNAMNSGVPVEAYCHWSLLDNFEWINGFAPRFGLYETRYQSQERFLRPSGQFYGSIARQFQMTEE